MLLNVDRWKREKIAERCTEFIKARKGKIEYVDQGVINGVLVRELKVVESPRFNLTALSWDFTYEEMQVYRKPDHGYSKQVWEEAKMKPAIIHFTTSFLSIRPWFEGSKTPWTKKWREYHNASTWNDKPLRVMENSESHEKKIRVFNMLPRRIAIGVAGVLHAYAKPAFFEMKNGLISLPKAKLGGYCDEVTCQPQISEKLNIDYLTPVQELVAV